MSFEFHGNFKEQKPELKMCSFCTLIQQIGNPNLTEKDIKIFRVHLVLAHGLAPEIEP